MINKKRLYFIFITACIFLFITSGDYNLTPFKNKASDMPYCPLLNADKTPSSTLLQLCQLTGIDHNGSLQSIVEKTQLSLHNGGWLRPAGTERADLPTSTTDKKVYDVLHALGFIDAIYPSKKRYTYAIVFGATALDLRHRLEFLNILTQEYGLEFQQLIFLVSQRARNIQHETDQIIFNTDMSLSADIVMPTTETEIAWAIYNHTTLSSFLKSVPVIFVDTPHIKKPDGTLVRADTVATIVQLHKMNLPPAPALFISSQPHHHRQHLLASKHMPSTFTVETAACACKKDENNLNLLDAAARSLYEEYVAINSSKKNSSKL